jgi:hypothetical protein
MRDINLNIQGIDMHDRPAPAMANSVAGMCERQAVIMAWQDKPRGLMGLDIPGGDLSTRWRDSGESYGGNLELGVNADDEMCILLDEATGEGG